MLGPADSDTGLALSLKNRLLLAPSAYLEPGSLPEGQGIFCPRSAPTQPGWSFGLLGLNKSPQAFQTVADGSWKADRLPCPLIQGLPPTRQPSASGHAPFLLILHIDAKARSARPFCVIQVLSCKIIKAKRACLCLSNHLFIQI